MSTQTLGTIWVCEPCMMAAEIGETATHEDGPEPWALLTPDTSATCGRTSEEHDTPCGSFDKPGGDFLGGECSCEMREFSWSACDGCGSTLGGSRHAYTLWSMA